MANEENEFRRIVSQCGYKEALFIFCAYKNIPYIKEIAKRFEEKQISWNGYLIELNKQNLSNKKFADGETDAEVALGYLEEINDNDREEWLAHWGTGTNKHPYTDEDYRELDKIYNAYIENRASTSKQTEISIDKIAKWTVEQNYAFLEGNIERAKKIEDLIKTEAEGEALRRKDEVPQDLERLNGIVKACEEKGLLGISFPELLKRLHPNYDAPKDMADKVLMAIINTTAWNEGTPTYDFIPDTIDMDDDLHEFKTEFDEESKDIYMKLGITIPPTIL